MDRNDMLCVCLEITRGTVEYAIKAKNLKSVEQVQEETEAGTVCGACIDDIHTLSKNPQSENHQSENHQSKNHQSENHQSENHQSENHQSENPKILNPKIQFSNNL